MGSGKLLGKIRDGRKKIEELKKELNNTIAEQPPKETESKAKKILGKIEQVLDKVNEVEKNGVSVSDIVNVGGNLIKDQIKNETVKDVIGKVQDVLEDGKVDVKEVIGAGLDVVKDNVKNERIQDIAKAAKDILDGKVKDYGDIFGVAADIFRREIEKAGLTDIVKNVKGFLDGVNSLEELLAKGKKELERLAKEAAKKLIGDFVNGFLNKGIKKEIISIKNYNARNKWGRLSMSLNMNLSLVGEIKGEFTGDALRINTQISCQTYTRGDFSLDVSFTIPVIKKAVNASLSLPVKGNLYCEANTQLLLTVKNMKLEGNLSPTTILSEFDMWVIINIPEWVVSLWNGAAEWSFGYLKPIQSPIEHKVGRYKVFKIEVPGYKASFDMKALQFSGAPTGGYIVNKGQDLENFIRKVDKYLPWA